MTPTRRIKSEGLRIVRLFMVLSSLAPLFVLMAIRGTSLFSAEWPFVVACLMLVVLPLGVLLRRVQVARDKHDVRSLTPGRMEDHRSHFLTYLLAALLPFYSEDFETIRELVATCIALMLVVFLFLHLNLHYVNLYFAVRGYRVFTIWPPDDGNPHTGQEPFVLITRRRQLAEGTGVIAYRLSDTVYLEEG